jgi:hypothetical protein
MKKGTVSISVLHSEQFDLGFHEDNGTTQFHTNSVSRTRGAML